MNNKTNINETNKKLLEKFIKESKRTTETRSLARELIDLYNEVC